MILWVDWTEQGDSLPYKMSTVSGRGKGSVWDGSSQGWHSVLTCLLGAQTELSPGEPQLSSLPCCLHPHHVDRLWLAVHTGLQEGVLKGTSSNVQTCKMLSVVPHINVSLAKASHMDKPRIMDPGRPIKATKVAVHCDSSDRMHSFESSKLSRLWQELEFQTYS